MNKKQNLIIGIAIFTMLLVFIGVTYAFFTANVGNGESASTIVTTSGNLTITYIDNSGDILLENVYPREEEWVTKSFTLKGSNSTDLNMNYKVGIVVQTNEFSEKEIAYTLTNNNPTSGTPISNTSRKMPISGTGTKWIGYGTFVKANDVSHTYTLKIYIEDTGKNQNAYQGKSFAGYIAVEEAGSDDNIKGTVPDSWLYPVKGSLLSAMKEKQKVPYTAENKPNNVTLTRPGTEKATTNEGLRVAEDDYGMSLYYRGSQENNFVVFADMCWRIVRVDGLGNTKLVLYNYQKGLDNPCSTTGNDLAYIRDTSNSKVFVKYNEDDVTATNAGVGFMYGSTDANATYDETHANEHEGNILSTLKTWYTNNFNEAERAMLADVVWCNDKSTSKIQLGGAVSTPNTGNGNKNTWYGTGERIVSTLSWESSLTATPSFKCPDSNGSDPDLSRFTASSENGNGALTIDGVTYKIGLLTADEVLFAGLVYTSDSENTNTTYYLHQNSSENDWWTLSPMVYIPNQMYIFQVNHSGRLVSAKSQTSTWTTIRPAIALPANTLVTTTGTGAAGTSANPFRVSYAI